MKSILLTFTLLTIFVSSTFSQTLKFGHFNSQALIETLPEVQEVLKTIEAETAKIEGQLTILQEDFQKMQQDYQQNAATMTDAVRMEKEAELQETYQKIQNFVALSRQQLEAKQRELMTPIMQKVMRTVQEVGQENDFVYIFEQQAALTLYVSETKSVDITPLVKKKLGIN